MTVVGKLSRRYIIQAVVLIIVVCAAVYGVKLAFGLGEVTVPLAVSVVFALVVECSDALVWRLVAQKSPDSLPQFYTAVSGFRMLLALGTMFVYWLVEGQENIRLFFVVFAAFYILLLAHHSIFFAGVSNSADKLNDVK